MVRTPHSALVCIDVCDPRPREGNVDSGETLDGKAKGGERDVRKVVNMSASGKPKYAPMTKNFDITIFVSPSGY
jgi:hypothetical protein